MAGGETVGTEGRCPASLHPLFWEGGDSPPTQQCGSPRKLWSRPYQTLPGSTQMNLGCGFDKCTHTPTNGCGAMEGTIAIRTYSASTDGRRSHGAQDLWGQFMRNALCLSPSVPWKSKSHWSIFLVYPQMLLPVIISSSDPSKRPPWSPSVRLHPHQTQPLFATIIIRLPLLDCEPLEGHG